MKTIALWIIIGTPKVDCVTAWEKKHVAVARLASGETTSVVLPGEAKPERFETVRIGRELPPIEDKITACFDVEVYRIRAKSVKVPKAARR